MRAIDTNVLVYAEIRSSAHHRTSLRLLTSLAEGIPPWAIPWPCIYEFIRIVTHPRVYHPPMPVTEVLADLAIILASPSVVVLSETPQHSEIMKKVLQESGATGNLVQDAHIATLCLEHGVEEFITGDRDFTRFSQLHVTNPSHPNSLYPILFSKE